MYFDFMRKSLWVVTIAIWFGTTTFGLEPRDFAFLLSAEASSDPVQITVTWPQKNCGSISVRRKLLGEQQWGPVIAQLDGNVTSFVDHDVQTAIAYEYEFSAQIYDNDQGTLGRQAYGYICAGVQLPVVENRGKVALVVDERFASELSGELERLRKDLIGDGWTVVRHDVSPDASPQSVKDLIKADYDADRDHMRAVFIFGHVPVPYSGVMNPDMHPEHLGAWPADVFYGEMDGTWTDSEVSWEGSEFSANNNVPGDGKFDQSQIPGPVELEVGRVDMWVLPSFEPRTEAALLRNYLKKDHEFRHGIVRAPLRGLIRDNFGIIQDDAPAVDAWRAFPALFGTNSWSEVGDGEFFPTLNRDSFLWAYGGGGGDRNKADGVGWTDDFATSDPKAIFYLLHGSWFGDWNTSDNFLRAAIATANYGVVSIWCSLPHWYFHPLALGETIGFATRLTQNNQSGVYTNDPNYSAGQAHISMMGDPTLHVFVLAPPANVRATVSEKVRLEWEASADAVEGYNVYRASDYDAPFVKLNIATIKELTFEEERPAAGHYVYMLKGVALQTTGSGSFWNLSQGIFAEVDVDDQIVPMISEPKLEGNAFSFEARGFANRSYRVESRPSEGSWRTRAVGTSDGDGLLTYRELLSAENVAELYRVVWE